MTLSAKWSAVSFVALTAFGAASFAFAGCTVTSGSVNDREGGIPITPDKDGGTDSAVANACPGNTKQTGTLIDDACQGALEKACCAQLTSCFNIVPDQDAAAGGTDDCNKYAACLDKCKTKVDGTPETDEANLVACGNDCGALTQKSVEDAYDAILECGRADSTAKTACKL